LLAEYLANHPLTWTDGKNYGVTMEDQTELSLNITQYQVAVAAMASAEDTENSDTDTETTAPRLEWHAIHEECHEWTLEDLSALAVAISNYVYPFYRLMQSYKVAIYACTEREDVRNIKLVYPEPGDDSTEENTEGSVIDVEYTEDVDDPSREEVNDGTNETTTEDEDTVTE
jgi:hypothetical protein